MTTTRIGWAKDLIRRGYVEQGEQVLREELSEEAAQRISAIARGVACPLFLPGGWRVTADGPSEWIERANPERHP